MLRREFIKMYADAVRDGRRKHYPDMRPSEEAVSRMSDEKSAARLWGKHRAAFAPVSCEAAAKMFLEQVEGG